MIIGKLLHTICPLCVYQELPVAKHKGKLVAFCPNGGDEKENTHTWFVVSSVVEGRIKYNEKPKAEKPKKAIVRKTDLEVDFEEEGGIANDEITRT